MVELRRGAAAELVAELQAEDGSWNIGADGGGLGHPATYGPFVATYLAERWKTELLVFTTEQSRRGVSSDTQDYARRYLEVHEVQAEFVVSDGGLTDDLMRYVQERQIDLVLMGGYSNPALRGVFIGSTLDFMLRESAVPIFICR